MISPRASPACRREIDDHSRDTVVAIVIPFARGSNVAVPIARDDIPLDADVLSWFRETGKGYQTRINNVLRAFVEKSQAHDAVRALPEPRHERPRVASPRS